MTATVLLLTASFATIIRPERKQIKVVCIDPGHGGKDPGCHGDLVKEKDVALAVSLRLGKYIEANYPDIKVVYTRSTDVFVELNERAAIANRNHADIFICIHCNSACVRKKGKDGKPHDVCNETAHGSATYVMGLHKTDGNLDVAKRENDAVLLEENYEKNYNLDINSDEAEIIFSTYQNEYLKESLRFAELCQSQFSTAAGRDDDGVKQAGFLVLWKTSMPSVLIETGFLTNPQEEKFLSLEKGQKHMAASIFRAFRKWKDELEGNTKVYTDEIEKMKPYQPESSDTAGLRKPVNYANPKAVVKPKTDTLKTVVPKKDTVALKVPVDTDKVVVMVEPKAVTVVYRVQIISSDKALKENAPQLKGLTDTWHYESKGSYKYTAGSYKTQAEAVKRQNELRKNGFPEAFVVVFDSNGKRLTLEEAKKFSGGK
ncbi:MAG: N-acetylmuramoyl-L-alanine amidase [Bacteroidota bacterium]|nr:N-acetylmuramoyl-L-alanine amidase [Bacteroidota bacterium]